MCKGPEWKPVGLLGELRKDFVSVVKRRNTDLEAVLATTQLKAHFYK